MEVKLNQAEEAMLEKLDPATRTIVAQQLIVAKTENLKLRAELQTRWNKTRNEFSIRLGDLGNVIITGLGTRFPFSPYPEQFETLMSHAEVVRKFIIDNKAELEKRYAGRDEVLKARKQAAKVASVTKLSVAK